MKIESNKNWTTCLRLNTGDGSPRVFLLNSHFLGSVPWFLGSFILQLIGIGLFISSIVINNELLIGPQMDSLTLPIFLYLIGVNLIEISGLIAYSAQEMSRGTFPWKIILGNILLIAYFNYAVFFYH